MKNIRTDLAMEKTEDQVFIPKGIAVRNDVVDGDIKVTYVNVMTQEGSYSIGKPIGKYITVECENIFNMPKEKKDMFSKTVASELKKVIDNTDGPILIVGLGNRDITPDALGPKSCEHIFVTRHIKEHVPDSIDERAANVCAIAPGVLGVTGLETIEVIKGIADKIKPSVIIAIDALASRKTNRIGCSVQISDSGIDPGSGIGNKRKALNRESLGTDVVAIGVPMVVYAHTIAADLIESAFSDISEEEIESLSEHIMNAKGGELIVTPKEVDMIVDKVAEILGNSINLAVNGELSTHEIENYMQ